MSKPAQGWIMEFMTVQEMREALRETRTAILPIGVIEQHGYHLPLNTDVYNAYEIAKRVAAVASCVVAPPVNYSFSGGELPGTVDISPQTLSLLVMDLVKSLADQGFASVILLLGHGGSENQRAVLDAADMFLRRNRRYRDVCIAVVTFTDLAPSIRELFAQKDFHAGWLETSLMLYWHPELVRPRELWVKDREELMELLRRDQDAYQVRVKPLEHPLVVPVVAQNPEIEVGVMGYPERASAEFGEKVVKEAVAGLAELVAKLESRR